MEIRNLITFNTIVEKNSFTKAAEHLGYAQSTVTLHIKELESHFKENLFDRIGKKIYLTTFGEKLYNKSKKIEYDYNNILTLANSNNQKQTLRIGGFESLLKYRLYDLVKSFKLQHPNIDIVIEYGTCEELRKMINEGLLDITFQLEEDLDFPNLIRIPLVEEHFNMILPPNSKSNLIYDKNQTVYLTEKTCTYRRMFEKYMSGNGINPQSTTETSSVDLIKQYVSFGLGFSLLPSIAIGNEIKKNKLTVLPFKSENTLLTQIAYHKDKYIFPAMQQFIAMVCEQAKDWK